MPAAVLILAAVAVACLPASQALAAARWPRRSPAVAIVLWQAIGLGWGLAAVGALAGLGADQHPGVLRGAYTLAGRLIAGRGLAAAGITGGIMAERVAAWLPPERPRCPRGSACWPWPPAWYCCCC